jgi:hypothetical protein
MRELLDSINQYSNLVVAFVTIMYVILTWQMVREMRRAREGQIAPQILATLVPLGPIYAQLCIQNVGAGPALEIESKAELLPAHGTELVIWRHPALMAGVRETFFLPSDLSSPSAGLPSLEQLSTKFKTLRVNVRWQDTFARRHSASFEFDLKETMDGWYKAGWVVPEEKESKHLKKIADELHEIRKDLHKVELHRLIAEFAEMKRKSKAAELIEDSRPE